METSALRRRVAPAVLLVGLGLAGVFLLRGAPREQELTLRIEGARGSLRRIDLALQGDDGEAQTGASWTFLEGKAPRQLVHRAQLRRGRYHVQLGLDTTTGPQRLERDVQLDHEPVTLPVRVDEGDLTPPAPLPEGRGGDSHEDRAR